MILLSDFHIIIIIESLLDILIFIKFFNLWFLSINHFLMNISKILEVFLILFCNYFLYISLILFLFYLFVERLKTRLFLIEYITTIVLIKSLFLSRITLLLWTSPHSNLYILFIIRLSFLHTFNSIDFISQHCVGLFNLILRLINFTFLSFMSFWIFPISLKNRKVWFKCVTYILMMCLLWTLILTLQIEYVLTLKCSTDIIHNCIYIYLIQSI